MVNPVGIPARNFWTDTGFNVQAKTTYHFRALGWWADLAIFRDADGYDAPFWYAIGKPPRELDGATYYKLWGAVFPDKGPGTSRKPVPGAAPLEVFPMGREGSFEPTQTGRLYAFVNDREGYYWQNAGKVQLYVANHELTVCEASGPIAAWNKLVAKTHGLPVIAGLLVLLIALFAFLEQGRDIMSTLVGPEWKLLQAATFWASAFFLGMQAWFWARIIINSNYGVNRQDWKPGLVKQLLIWTPRLFAFLPFLAAALAFAFGGEGDDRWGWAILAIGFGVFLEILLIFRQRFFHAVTDRKHTGLIVPQPSGSTRWEVKVTTKAFKAAILRHWLAVGGAVLSLLVLAAICIWPVAIPQFLGAPAVLYFGVAFIIPVVAGVANLIRVTRFPLIPALIILGIVFSPFNDNHRVGRRTAFMGEKVAEMPLVSSKPSLEEAVASWKAKQTPIKDKYGKDVYPIVFVSSEGGASRAGYWTALVLDRLQRKTKEAPGERFSDRLFAISSVSGGSVGSAGFVAAIAKDASPGAPQTWPLLKFAEKDFLSPALAGVLYPDLVQRFLPWPMLPDGAEALERAWEEGWAAGCNEVGGKDKPGCSGTDNVMQAAFLSMWPKLNAAAGTRWVPMLLVNGAREEDGKRIITAPFEIKGDDFPNTLDFHLLTKGDVRLSTAILNGARFPYISPPGTLTVRNCACSKLGHIVDGGYFDASGTETLADLITAVMKTDTIKTLEASGAVVQPVVIEISNSDTVPPSGMVRTDSYEGVQRTPEEDKSEDVSNEVLGPVRGLLGAQGSHGGTAVVRLAKQGAGGRAVKHAIVHLYPLGEKTLSLDWAFSPAALKRARVVAGVEKDSKLGDDPCHVGKQIDGIATALSNTDLLLNKVETWAKPEPAAACWLKKWGPVGGRPAPQLDPGPKGR